MRGKLGATWLWCENPGDVGGFGVRGGCGGAKGIMCWGGAEGVTTLLLGTNSL